MVDVILKNEGFETLKFYDSLMAQKEIKENNNIDLAILDVMMAGIDGFSLIDRRSDKVEFFMICVTLQ